MAGPIEIPNFELIREIGRGGMAQVWLAEQKEPKRKVAVKIVSPSTGNDDDFMRSLKQEGDTVAQFNHQNIVTVYACGVIQSHYFLAMEILSGGDLAHKIKQGLSPEDALNITYQLSDALAHAHKRNTLHRDIKPENILFNEEGRAVLVDFGIAKETDKDSEFTRMGCLVGTPHYMSPERAQGKPVDARSDLYAVGVVLYEMLTGKKLYEKSDTFAVSYAHVYEPIPPLPAELIRYQALLNRLLAKSPDDRFQTADDILQAINQFDPATRPIKSPGSNPQTRAVDISDTENPDHRTRVQTNSIQAGEATKSVKADATRVLSTKEPLTRAGFPKKWIFLALAVMAGILLVFLFLPQDANKRQPGNLLSPEARLEMTDKLNAARTFTKLGQYNQASDLYYNILVNYDCNNAEALTALKALDENRYQSTVDKCDSFNN